MLAVRLTSRPPVKETGIVSRLRDSRSGERISIAFDVLVPGGDGRIRTGYPFIEA